VLLSDGSVGHANDVPCANRVVVVELSSSVRTDTWRAGTIDLISAAAASAAVCKNPFAAYAVVGGGRVIDLMSADDVNTFTPIGPNNDVRRSRFGADEESAVQSMVTARFDEVLATEAGIDSSSIAASYAVVAEHDGPDTDALLITDGVNHDAAADLNRPLDPGEGDALASSISTPALEARQLTIVGLGQVDSTLPPPGTSWLDEVRAFNATLCEQSGAGACRIFTVAATGEALAVAEEVAR